MLSLFPNLFSYPLFAYTLLRLVVVWGVMSVGVRRWKKPAGSQSRSIAFVEFIAGILILIGLYTQGALIAAIILLIIDLAMDRSKSVVTREQRTVSIIIILIAVALLFTGPGAFAFDLPL